MLSLTVNGEKINSVAGRLDGWLVRAPGTCFRSRGILIVLGLVTMAKELGYLQLLVGFIPLLQLQTCQQGTDICLLSY
jgi:hypothetical protein